MLVLLLSASLAQSTPPASWEQTLERVVPGVVALRVTAVRDFDTEGAGNSVGTGFVVDRERGILLTNRHMVHAGPVLGEAVLLDHEELDLEAIYRDPVHDFGFYRFDPTQVRFMDLPELTLAPEKARVGSEIRVIGNDAGEKISILDGTLARLDRTAPRYGQDTYNDFNTFYLQAASGTSGGSSGSPVVNIDGEVVGLNAGGSREAASSFYLPLDRVVRALALIREGLPVTRGTLLTTFEQRPYDECRRLGLTESRESALREAFPEGTGALVVERTLPGSAAFTALQSGDILVAVEGGPVEGFVGLEATLDERVGGEVDITVERGGKTLELTLPVEDLHAVSPSSYLEVGRAVLNDVSYQVARNHAHPLEGVYLAASGYMFGRANLGAGRVITAINGEPTPDLDALQAALEKVGDRELFQVRSHTVQDIQHEQVDMVTMDRTWNQMRRCSLNADGAWPCVDAAPAPEPTPTAPRAVLPPVAPDKVSARVASALVMVDFDVPYSTAGTRGFNYQGVGTVIDAKQGLVLVDRDTVPTALGDIALTFAGSVRVEGRLVWLDPVHNAAVVQYDPSMLGDTPVGEVTFVERDLQAGDVVWQVGLDRHQQVSALKTSVERVQPIALQASTTPRFRDVNASGVDLVSSAPSLGGVLVDRRGRGLALWGSFLDPREGERRFHGLPTAFLPPQVRGEEAEGGGRCTLGAELQAVSLAEARDRGLADHRATAIVAADPRGRRVFEVVRVDGRAPAREVLRDGDLIVSLGAGRNAVVAGYAGLEELTRDCDATLMGTLLRDGGEVEVAFAPQHVLGSGVDRIVNWAGLVLHAPHREVDFQQGITAEGVYVAWLWYGSPASRYGLRPTRRITAVNDVPTPDMDAFIAAVAGLQDRQSVRLTTVLLDGTVRVTTLRLDLTYWPTSELTADAGRWQTRIVE